MMMRCVGSVLLCLLAAPALAQADARAELEARRDVQAAEFDRQEQACSAQFAVTDCVNRVKARRIAVMAEFRKQENALNDADRRQRAQDELQRLEQRKAERTDKESQAAQVPANAEQQRLREAQLRQQQHGPQGTPRAAASAPVKAASKDAGTVQQNEKAYAQRQQEAASRRAERDKRLQEKKNGKPVPDLPTPR